MSLDPRRSKDWRAALAPLAAALVIAFAAVLSACAEVRTNGNLCSGCTEEDPCDTEPFQISAEELPKYCGDQRIDQCDFCSATAAGFTCQATLTCAHQQNSAARRCYPAVVGTSTPLATFECDGEVPG
ncbi:MAG TPA: hypothetical protein VFD92_07410 [Candidatus Binatia bacterium]|nr:hypothetical protein [Candidatus Binatia bacterium]